MSLNENYRFETMPIGFARRLSKRGYDTYLDSHFRTQDTSMKPSPTAENLASSSWDRVASAIREAISKTPWNIMPTVFLETFEAECKREGELMIDNGAVLALFPKTKQNDLLDPNFPNKLFRKIERLHAAQRDELLMSYLYTVDREGLEGEIASTVADALCLLHALDSRWKGESSFSAPQIAFTLWNISENLEEIFPATVQLIDAHLSSIRGYYDHAEGKDRAEEIWIEHSLSKKHDLMQRSESLGQLAQTETEATIAAFLVQRGGVDISTLTANVLESVEVQGPEN